MHITLSSLTSNKQKFFIPPLNKKKKAATMKKLGGEEYMLVQKGYELSSCTENKPLGYSEVPSGS